MGPVAEVSFGVRQRAYLNLVHESGISRKFNPENRFVEFLDGHSKLRYEFLAGSCSAGSPEN
jgi:hypothetical protein